MLLFLVGCKFIELTEDRVNSEILNTHELMLVDTVELNIDPSVSATWNSIEFHEDENVDQIYALDWLKQMIVVFDLDRGIVEKKIELNLEGPNSIPSLDIENSYLNVKSYDSLYLYHQKDRNLYLIDSSGTIISKTSFSFSDIITPFSSYQNSSAFVLNKLIFPTRLNFVSNNLSRESSFFSYNDANGEASFHGSLPQEFDNFPFGLHNSFYEAQLCPFNTGDLMLGYGGVPSIYIYNSHFDLVNEIDLAHPDFDSPEKFEHKVNFNDQYTPHHNDIWTYSDFYGRIYRIDDSNYLRIVRRAKDPTVPNSNFKYSAILFDSKLNIRGVKHFPQEIDDMRYCFVDSNGYFYIFNSHLNVEFDNEDVVYFNKYKIDTSKSE